MNIYANDRRDERARIRDRMLGRPHTDLYQGYLHTDTDDQVRAAYAAKYHAEPQEIIRNAGATLAGPIPQEDPNA